MFSLANGMDMEQSVVLNSFYGSLTMEKVITSALTNYNPKRQNNNELNVAHFLSYFEVIICNRIIQ